MRSDSTHNGTTAGTHRELVDNVVPESVEERLLLLIDSNPRQGVSISQVKDLYHSKFGELLDCAAHGNGKLKNLVTSFPSIQVVRRKKEPHLVRSNAASPSSVTSTNANVPSSYQKASEISNPLNATTTTGNAIQSKRPIKLIDTVPKLKSLLTQYPFGHLTQELVALSPDHKFVAIGCEGVAGELFLIQVATHSTTIVLDCVTLGATECCKLMTALLTDERVVKLFHDLHKAAMTFAKFGVEAPLRGCFDSQLAMEHIKGALHIGFDKMINAVGAQGRSSKDTLKRRMKSEGSGSLFRGRPLPDNLLAYAAENVYLLLEAKTGLETLLTGDYWACIQRASDVRAFCSVDTGGERQVSFNAGKSYAISSTELLQEISPGDILAPQPLVVSEDTSTLLGCLPRDLSDELVDKTEKLCDINIDIGRSPQAWIGGERFILGQDRNRKVEMEEITAIASVVGGFGSDNRAGVERQLHRISAIRNRNSNIIGLTMRVGRHVTGNSHIISDLLFADTKKSVLFMGEPGSGKTTVVREVTRVLAQQANVCIVDTSNEIAGDGDIPHPCVGYARRLMVPSLDEQSAVMIECVQNHTPEIMVIDEIGRSKEVEAARTCKNRGVRLIASAHGDLRSLVKNAKLRGLVGGVEQVTLGDEQAKKEAKQKHKDSVQKTKAERGGDPTFEIIVELSRGKHNTMRVFLDSGDAVDKILDGLLVQTQLRSRNPETGTVQVAMEMI